MNPIKGIKLIKLNSQGIDNPPDPSYPFTMKAILRPPEFMTMAFIGLVGGYEELIVQGKTKEAIHQFIKRNDLDRHPRLISLKINDENIKGE
jgi:hypothetical protein